MNIWFTSDLHFGHDKDFIWKARGYESVQDMNEQQVEKFNSKVQPEDTVYILGDVIMGNSTISEQYLARLNGQKIIILGNHDTNSRIEIYKKYADKIVYADLLKYKKRTIYLSHFPTVTANTGDTLGHCTLNFYGHTHQTTDFYEDRYNMFHVGVDSHNGYPILIDDALAAIKEKAIEKGEN